MYVPLLPVVPYETDMITWQSNLRFWAKKKKKKKKNALQRIQRHLHN